MKYPYKFNLVDLVDRGDLVTPVDLRDRVNQIYLEYLTSQYIRTKEIKVNKIVYTRILKPF